MIKKFEKISKQLTEISGVVKSFQSEAVQLKIVSWMLEELKEDRKSLVEDADYIAEEGTLIKKKSKIALTVKGKKPGATKILNQVLKTDYFEQARTIAEIAEYCTAEFDADVKTSELSGILLKLANENKLKRERSSDNNRFTYVIVKDNL